MDRDYPTDIKLQNGPPQRQAPLTLGPRHQVIKGFNIKSLYNVGGGLT